MNRRGVESSLKILQGFTAFSVCAARRLFQRLPM
jgi:hypothetical protein